MTSPSRTLALAALVGALGACAERPADVVVGATDYAFQAPATLDPGRTVFTLDNRGQVPHELVLARLKPGATVEQALTLQQQGGDPGELLDGTAGVIFANPGERSPGSLVVDLAPGRSYALVCALRDGEGAPPHAAMGMHGSFQVRGE